MESEAMTRYLLLYCATALVLFPLDAIWLGYVARGFYVSRLGDLMLDQPRFGIAALLAGVALGFIAYGTYDATNLATLRGYTVQLAVVDLLWGMTLTGISAAGGMYIATRWFGVSLD